MDVDTPGQTLAHIASNRRSSWCESELNITMTKIFKYITMEHKKQINNFGVNI